METIQVVSLKYGMSTQNADRYAILGNNNQPYGGGDVASSRSPGYTGRHIDTDQTANVDRSSVLLIDHTR